jgi:hypothetical protein
MRWRCDGAATYFLPANLQIISEEKKKICARKNSDVLLVVKHQLATKILEF